MRHDQPGYYALKDLPQRPSIAANSFSTGWEEMDIYLRLYLGQFIVCTGIAGHGKSTFLMNLICNLARSDGIRSFLYVPENEAHIANKLKGIWRNDVSFSHFSEFQCFIQSALPLSYDDPPKTLDWVLTQAVRAVEEDKVSLLLIDPWNELERAKPKDMLLSDYIGQCLMSLKQFCRAYNVIVCMVAHPTKAVAVDGGRVPTLSDIEGSMNWYNKCDNGLIIARDLGTDTARVISAKVREIGAGKVGACHFFVDPKTGVFTPQIGADIEQREEAAGNRSDHPRDRRYAGQAKGFRQ